MGPENHTCPVYTHHTQVLINTHTVDGYVEITVSREERRNTMFPRNRNRRFPPPWCWQLAYIHGLLTILRSSVYIYSLLSKQRATHQKFLTWLSVLPGRRFAISDQRFPISDLALVMVASSAFVHAPFLMRGSVLFLYVWRANAS